jgi:amino acid adenylation domain-containing protein
MHHIVSDGWSVRVLSREWSQLYQAYFRSQQCPLPDLEIQYPDFAAGQREWLQGDVLDGQLEYWKRQLEGMAPLEMPTDHPRPAVASHSGGTVRLRLPAALTQELKKFSQRQGVTLFMSLLGAFQAVLSRYARQEDVAVGTAVANRNRRETEGLIGLFANTVVLRTDLSRNPSLAEVVKRVRRVTLDAFERQDVPFETLVEQLQPDRDLSRNALFQVMLTMQETDMQELQMPGLHLEAFPYESHAAKFDLLLALTEDEQGIRGDLSYARDLYEASTAERLLEHLKAALETMVTDPERRLGEFPLLRPWERRQMLLEWNRTNAEYPEECLHELFEKQAARTPRAAAVQHQGRQVSYAELNRRANQLARYLRELGIGPEVRVGVCVERSVEMIVALLATLKSGGAYVPLDPGYPPERLHYMLEDAQVAVLLAGTELRGQPAPSFAQTVCLAREAQVIGQRSTANLSNQLEGENLAYVIYTSGSTGRPKGVAITHRSAGVLMHWGKEVFTDEELKGVLAATSICFDLSVFEIFLPLTRGGKVLLAENALELPKMVVAKDKVTLINTVPSAMAELIRMQAIPSSVKTVNLAGEALHSSLVEQVYANAKIERLFNLYGPSEDTTYSTYACLQRGERNGATASIGRPIAKTQAYVLDDNLEPVPVGVRGELYLGGAGLARGYLNRPELTAERFIPNPHGEGRIYRTGDQVRWRADGTLEFLGRLDRQVKIRGYRIELEEIKSVLEEQPEVRAAAVAVNGNGAGEAIAAYIVPRENARLDVERLGAALQDKLPHYMIPSTYVVISKIPLTPNGKLDHDKLTGLTPVTLSRSHAEPQTPVQKRLAEVWGHVLGVKDVGLHDKFLRLGGNSLLGMQVVAEAERRGLSFTIRDLFRHQAIAELATVVREI